MAVGNTRDEKRAAHLDGTLTPFSVLLDHLKCFVKTNYIARCAADRRI